MKIATKMNYNKNEKYLCINRKILKKKINSKICEYSNLDKYCEYLKYLLDFNMNKYFLQRLN